MSDGFTNSFPVGGSQRTRKSPNNTVNYNVITIILAIFYVSQCLNGNFQDVFCAFDVVTELESCFLPLP